MSHHVKARHRLCSDPVHYRQSLASTAPHRSVGSPLRRIEEEQHVIDTASPSERSHIRETCSRDADQVLWRLVSLSVPCARESISVFIPGLNVVNSSSLLYPKVHGCQDRGHRSLIQELISTSHILLRPGLTGGYTMYANNVRSRCLR